MSEHQKLLRTIFENLDEQARIAFLREMLDSLPAETRQNLLKQQPSQSPTEWIDAVPPERPVVSEETVPASEVRGAWVADPSENVNDVGNQDVQTAKEKRIQEALATFEQQQSLQTANQKSTMRKEAVSCLGLILLALGVLVGASVGLKYLWQMLFP